MILLFPTILLLPAMASAATLNVGALPPPTILFDIDGTVNGQQQEEHKEVYAGSIDGSTLGGDPLEWLYCVDLFKNVTVGGNYYNTEVSTTGDIYGTPLNHKEDVTWLLYNYATDATTLVSQALQAAIWTTIYGPTYDLSNSDPAYSTYYDMLTVLHGENTSGVDVSDYDYLWISPREGTNYDFQGLVGVKASPVPVPAAVWLLGSGLVGLVGVKRRKRQK